MKQSNIVTMLTYYFVNFAWFIKGLVVVMAYHETAIHSNDIGLENAQILLSIPTTRSLATKGGIQSSIPSSNDECQNAIEIVFLKNNESPCNYAIQGVVDFSATSDTFVIICGLQGPSGFIEETPYGHWYKVVGSGRDIQASTCSEVTNFDTAISVYSGSCDDNTLECVGGNVDDYTTNCPFSTSTTFQTSSYTWTGIKDVTYYILLHADTGSLGGSFGLTISEVDYPENDMCDTAESITPGEIIIQGSIKNAAVFSFKDHDNEIKQCGARGTLDQGAAVWYSITGTGKGLQASTCFQETNYVTAISIYSGSCDMLTCIGGDKFGTSPSCSASIVSGAATTYSWLGEANVTYYVVVHATYSWSVGNFGLSVTEFDVPNNNQCPNAISIVPNGTTIQGSTFNAIMDASVDELYCKGSIFTPGVWYSVMGSGTHLQASTCSQYTTFDTSISIYEGSCDALSCVGSSLEDQSGNCNNNKASTIYWFAKQDKTYYIFIHGSWPETGLFGLHLIELNVPSNDQCPDAIPIIVGDEGVVYHQGSTLNATEYYNYLTENNDNVILCNGLYLSTARSVWYTVIGNDKQIQVSTCSQYTNYDTEISVFAGNACNDLNCVYNNDRISTENSYYCEATANNDNNVDASKFSWFGEMDKIYYIVIHSAEYTKAGSFGLILMEWDIPTNNECPDAIPITISNNSNNDGMISIQGTTKYSSPFSSFYQNNIHDNIICTEESFIGSPSVWYKIVGTGKTLQASSCTEYTNYYIAITIFSGQCSDLSCVEDISNNIVSLYNNKSTTPTKCKTSNVNHPSIIDGNTFTWWAENNVTYYILAHSQDTYSSGSFGLTITELTNDKLLCQSAMSIKSNETLVYDYNSKWYTIIGSGGYLSAIIVSTTEDSTVDNDNIFGKLSFSVYYREDSSSCDNLVCALPTTTNNDNNGGLNSSDCILNDGNDGWWSEPGTEYIIEIIAIDHEYNGNDYFFAITEVFETETPPSLPINNDDYYSICENVMGPIPTDGTDVYGSIGPNNNNNNIMVADADVSIASKSINTNKESSSNVGNFPCVDNVNNVVADDNDNIYLSAVTIYTVTGNNYDNLEASVCFDDNTNSGVLLNNVVIGVFSGDCDINNENNHDNNTSLSFFECIETIHGGLKSCENKLQWTTENNRTYYIFIGGTSQEQDSLLFALQVSEVVKDDSQPHHENDDFVTSNSAQQAAADMIKWFNIILFSVFWWECFII